LKRSSSHPQSIKLDAKQLDLALFTEEARPAATPPASTDESPSGTERRRPILLAGEVHHYRLRRAKRRTIGFQIDDAGLTVSAPRWVRLAEIEAAIVEKERWIRTKLNDWRDWRAKRNLPRVHYADGGTLPYLGQPVTLRLHREQKITGLIESDGRRLLCLALPPESTEAQIKDAVQAWLQTQARRVLDERLRMLAERSGLTYTSWTLSSARGQWGSCTHDGRIRLNWRLVHFALPVIDYVVAHELAHVREMNHGPRFWSAVGQLLPGFEAARDEIKGVDLASL
jgi:predicted metal-dependent hydrolase